MSDDGRRCSELGRQPVDDREHACAQLAYRTGNVQRPGAIAIVPAQLADDRRRGVRGQLDLTARIEAIERLEESDPGDLEQVVERLAPLGVACRQRAHETAVALDELLAGGVIAVALPPLDQTRFGGGAHGVSARRLPARCLGGVWHRHR